MNEIIRTLYEMGLGKTFYDIFFALGFVSVLVGLIWFGKNLNFRLKKLQNLFLLFIPLLCFGCLSCSGWNPVFQPGAETTS